MDENGELLGFDLYRDEWGKKPIPEGAHHRVVEIFTVTKQGEVLCTQRDPKKRIFALKWEVTGGSVVKGEKPLAGAVRELREETGIVKQPEELTFCCVRRMAQRCFTCMPQRLKARISQSRCRRMKRSITNFCRMTNSAISYSPRRLPTPYGSVFRRIKTRSKRM